MRGVGEWGRGLDSEPGMVSRAEGDLCVWPSCSLEGKGKDTLPSDFWDHLKEQLTAVPPDFSCALELLKEIKEVSWKIEGFQGLSVRPAAGGHKP